MCDFEDKMHELNEDYRDKVRELELEEERKRKKAFDAFNKFGLTCLGVGFFSGSLVSSAFYLWLVCAWSKKILDEN